MSAGAGFVARALLAFLHDVTAVGVAWLGAYWLRFNLEVPPPVYLQPATIALPAVLAVHAVVFWLMGLYRGLWRYASLPDLQRILVAASVAALATPALFTLIAFPAVIPRSVYLIAPVLLVGIMGGSRLLYRAWKERALLGMVRNPPGAAGAGARRGLGGGEPAARARQQPRVARGRPAR